MAIATAPDSPFDGGTVGSGLPWGVRHFPCKGTWGVLV